VCLEPATDPLGQQVQHHESRVVPGGCITRTRIAQADDQLPCVTLRLLGRHDGPDPPGYSALAAGPSSGASRSAGASPGTSSAASSSSAVGASCMLSSTCSGSPARAEPVGSVRPPAAMCSPIPSPSMLTSISLG